MGRRINARWCPRGARGRGARLPPWACLPPSWPPRKAVAALLWPQESEFLEKKISAKVSIQSELRISIYIRNGERAAEENAETERDRETDPISEGLSPLPRHGGQGPEGKPFSHLGRRSRKKKTKGPPLPFSSGGAGTLPWPSSSPQSSPTTSPPSSPTLPPSMQRCNLSLTRCNLYLNMVLNAIYYFPMMYGYPMMFE